MKCYKQFQYHRIPISNLWEVKLSSDLFERVKIAAQNRQCTLSWITRYCVFRVARKKSFILSHAMKIHSSEVKTQYRSLNRHHLHRHILCLYGDDEKLLRFTAMQLQMTVSHLIRFALEWYLPRIENFRIHWEEIFYYGTKICRSFSTTRNNMFKLPYLDVTFYEKWSLEEWWGHPCWTLQIPFSPSRLA